MTALLSNPFADASIASLDVDTESPMVELEADCDEALVNGGVLAIRTCLEGAVDVESAEAGSDPTLAMVSMGYVKGRERSTGTSIHHHGGGSYLSAWRDPRSSANTASLVDVRMMLVYVPDGGCPFGG